jgi:SAM-dependent methyltransferase
MPDTDKLHQFLGKMVTDMGAAMNASLVLIGDKLGLFKALADKGPMSSEELAKATGTHERYVREWLSSQAASGYVEYDGKSKFSLTAEQAMVFADPESPVAMAGAFDVIAAAWRDEPKITEAFTSGKGVGWHEHHPCLFRGTERFFRSGYKANLVSNWLPALEGVVQKLEKGGIVADVGCGHGASTLIMAEAFPKAEFVGFDYHDASIQRAREAAKEAGLAKRVRFDIAKAKEYPGKYDLVCFFDCLHDMGDPQGAAAHVRQTLKPDGVWMIVEPFANDTLAENLNPVGRLYYGASTMFCTPASLSQEVGLGLGAQAGEARLREVVTKGGFTRFRRATETPFNLIFEARS